MIDKALFQKLLTQSENESLDFKQGQYAFAQATPEQKSEILKDILHMANVARRPEAYILLGVREESTPPHTVVGITQHLPEHSLQQFVRSKVQGWHGRPLRFHYGTLKWEGKSVDIIRIPCQPAPFCLSTDYGKLKADLVYVRRGSSNDPTNPATPRESYLISQASTSPWLHVDLADPDTQQSLPNPWVLAPKEPYLSLPKPDELPTRYESRWEYGRWINREWYPDYATYCHHCMNLQAVSFRVVNKGEAEARDIRLELRIPATPDFEVIAASDVQTDPPAVCSRFPGEACLDPDLFRGLGPSSPGDVRVTRRQGHFTLETDFDLIQPGLARYTEPFHFTCRQAAFEIVGQLYAANLPQPEKVTLSVQVHREERSISVEEFCRRADEQARRLL